MRTQISDYASGAMVQVWSPDQRIYIERNLWILIMSLQQQAGVNIPVEAIEDYERIVEDINLVQIAEIEQKTGHDLRARLVAFNELAGHSYAHWGLTSCDVTDNATQVQIKLGLDLLRGKCFTVLRLLADHIRATRDVVCVARTHNLPAQATLLGKKFATVADEFLCGMADLTQAVEAMACRGLVGAVGTGQDLLDLLDGDLGKLERMNETFVRELGFSGQFLSVGQVYHRSEDAVLASTLCQLAAAPTNLARMVRLETGDGRMWEHFDDGQTGSSAMPHKRNSILSERICGLAPVIRGFSSMIQETSGATWYEGDVSDSVTRRVGLSGLFFAADAVLSNTVRLLEKLEIDKQAYADDLAENTFSISTGRILTDAIRRGVSRDYAYEVLQNYTDWVNLSSRLGITRSQLVNLMERVPLPEATRQIDQILDIIDSLSWEGEPDAFRET